MTARIGQLDVQAARRALRTDGLRVATGPFNCSLRTDVDEIAPALLQLYAHHPTVPAGDMIDLHVEVAGGRGLRRWVRPQAHFRVDDVSPFTPLARAQALLDEGDVEGAVAALDPLNDSAREVLAPWFVAANRRIEIDRHVSAVRADALAELSRVSRAAAPVAP